MRCLYIQVFLSLAVATFRPASAHRLTELSLQGPRRGGAAERGQLAAGEAAEAAEASAREATAVLGPAAGAHAKRRAPSAGSLSEASASASASASLSSRRRPAPTSQDPEDEPKTFMEALKQSMKEFAAGILLIIFSVPVLWYNEQRAARMETLIQRGSQQIVSVSGKAPQKEYHNWPIHINDELAVSAAPVQDEQFDVTLQSDCLMLMSRVEVYQVTEHMKTITESRHQHGPNGMQEVRMQRRVYEYTESWDCIFKDSSNYHDSFQRRNWVPPGLRLGGHAVTCSRVEFGDGFLLPPALVQQSRRYKCARPRLPDKIHFIQGNLPFVASTDGMFYHCVNNRKPGHGPPQVGDCRVQFTVVSNGPASVVGLQTEAPGEYARATLMPYRLIWRGFWCCGRGESEQALLRREADKSTSELSAEAGCPCFLSCLCCAFHLVAKLFAHVPPQLFHLYDGAVDLPTCLANFESDNVKIKWAMRIFGWVMMFAGSYCLFSPFLTLLKAIPFIGAGMAKFGGAVIWIICGIVTSVASLLVVSFAYLFFHPQKAFIMMAIAGALIVGGAVLLGYGR